MRRQLTLTRDGLVAKAGFENKKEGTLRNVIFTFSHYFFRYPDIAMS